MRGDNWKFILALAVSLLLAGGVVYQSYITERRTSAGPTVDLQRIEKLAREGQLSLHPAAFWAPVSEPEP